VDDAAALPGLAEQLRGLGLEPRGTERARAHADLEPLYRPLGYEWANDGDRVSSVTVDLVGGLEEEVELANRETPGLAAGLVAEPRGRARRRVLRAVAEELAAVDAPICVVSSGAIALGLGKMGLDRRPRTLPKLQAASALGQAALQRAWEDALGAHGKRTGQVLLTSAEIADRRAYVNVRNALGALFSLGAVPVVNENDATATDEISFGDNDALAAQVAVLARARLLVLLTSVEGVLTEVGGSLIADGASARAAVFGPATATGSGGMESKVLAAELAAAAGIPTVIAGSDALAPI